MELLLEGGSGPYNISDFGRAVKFSAPNPVGGRFRLRVILCWPFIRFSGKKGILFNVFFVPRRPGPSFLMFEIYEYIHPLKNASGLAGEQKSPLISISQGLKREDSGESL